jgi:hypothetical protein
VNGFDLSVAEPGADADRVSLANTSGPAERSADPTGFQLLSLQRLAGNQAVTDLVQRRERRDLADTSLPVPEGDWREQDQVVWRRDVGSWPNTNNTFIKAAVFNTKNNRPDEYQSIFERSEYYGVINALLQQDAKTKDVEFFGAASRVTSGGGIGAIEAPAGEALHSADTIRVLADINKLLFAANMKIINKLVNDQKKPTDPRDSRSTDEITAMNFDLDMVETEQGLVETYLTTHVISDQAKQEINDDLNFRGILRSIGEILTDTTSFDWAKAALAVDQLDFMMKSHRVAVGKALVFYLHGKSLDDFKKYMAGGPVP